MIPLYVFMSTHLLSSLPRNRSPPPILSGSSFLSKNLTTPTSPMLSKCLNSHLNLHVRTLNDYYPTKIITPLKSLSFTSSPRLAPTNHVSVERITCNRIMVLDGKSNTTASEDISAEFGPEPDPTLTNDDLRPTTPAQRTLSGWEMASLWVGLVVGVPSYYLAGSLVDLGMAWWQGIATVVVANVILLAPLMLTGHAGTRYGIPFPVLARSAFGVRGAHVPTLLRALVGCGWYGIETWIGGEAIFLLLPKGIKGSGELTQTVPWLGTSPLEFACFMLFWFVQLAIVLNGMDGIRELEKYSAPILIVLTSCLLAWSYVAAGGFGHMLSMSSRLSPAQFWALFFPSLTANISFWATLALNIPDFTRYARSQSDQIVGQAGLPVFMGLFTFVGLAVTSSTNAIFGRVISSPIQLLGEIGGFWTVALAIFGISLATITTNIAANVVAPANALVNLNPSRFTFRTGTLVTAILGVAFQPWRLLKSSESFVYTWLVGYSALLGPIGGILLSDYYLLRKTQLKINDLYTLSPSGAYHYSGGFNRAGLAALAIGILPVVPGFLQNVGFVQTIPRTCVVIYENAWFFSFFLAGVVYCVLTKAFHGKSRNTHPYDESLLLGGH